MATKRKPHQRKKSNKKQNTYLRAAAYTGVSIVALAIAVVLINLYDPAINPDAVAAMSPKPSDVPDAQNAYFVHFGLGVAAKQNPHAYGVEMVTTHKALIEAADRGTPQDENRLGEMDKQGQAVNWKGDVSTLCNEQRVNCLADYAGKHAQVAKLAADNRLRLARYRSLYRYKYFRETMPIRIYSPVPQMALPEHEVVLAQIALGLVDGDVDAAMRSLVTDTTYWRRVLANAETMLSKAIAAHLVERNYALAAEIGARYKKRRDVGSYLAQMLTPLSADERNWKRPLMGEFQWSAHLYQALPRHAGEFGVMGEENSAWDRVVTKMFLKVNATINRQYDYLETIQSLSAAPSSELLIASQRLESQLYRVLHPGWWSLGYNGVGKLLVGAGAMSPTNYAKYVSRTHNLDARIRLLALQLDIYQRRTSDKDIEAYLEKTTGDQLDPFRNLPFRWDSATRELWFEGVDPRGVGEIVRARIGVPI